MQPELIRDISETIVRDQFLLNWRFYTLILVITFLTSAASHWLSSYFKKRGETFATKADMQEILNQVSEITHVTEKVRSAISQADWVAREWRATRRLKLEELMSAVYSLEQWLEQQQAKWVYQESVVVDERPLNCLKLLTTLYFPELKTESTAVWLTHQKALVFILEISKRVQCTNNNRDLEAHQRTLNEFAQGWKPLYDPACAAIGLLERKASSLMEEIASA